MHNKSLYFLLLLFLFSSISCQSSSNNKKQPMNKISSSLLFDTQWILHHSNQKTLSIFLKLTEDEKVSGFSGCNKFFGKMSLSSDNKISFGRLATTRKKCPKIMQFESSILSGLSSITHFKIETHANLNKLYLYNKQTEVFIFTSNKVN